MTEQDVLDAIEATVREGDTHGLLVTWQLRILGEHLGLNRDDVAQAIRRARGRVT